MLCRGQFARIPRYGGRQNQDLPGSFTLCSYAPSSSSVKGWHLLPAPPPPAQAYSCRESLSLPSLLIMTCASPSCLWLGTVPRIMHLRPGPVTAGSLLFLGWPSIFQRGGSPLHGWIRGNRENSPPAQMLPGRHVADEFSHTHRSAHRNALLPPVLSSPLPPTRIL